jgi:hypothetical protein
MYRWKEARSSSHRRLVGVKAQSNASFWLENSAFLQQIGFVDTNKSGK